MALTAQEKDRLCEYIFAYYFRNTDPDLVEKEVFWKMVKAICEANGIEPLLVTKAVRLLHDDITHPDDIEVYYLLNAVNTSVRKMNKLTGIYYARQTIAKEYIEKHGKPVIYRKITDVPMRVAIRKFINAIYQLYSGMSALDYDSVVENLF